MNTWTRGLPAATATIVASEVQRLVWRLGGALEEGDLWSIALMTADANRDVPAALLRMRVRYALRTALRREWRAQGRVERTVRWPVYWPRTFHNPGIPGHQRRRRRYTVTRCVDCRTELEHWAKRCAPCNRVYRVAYKRANNAAYRARHKQTEAA